jgi:hypothetical protein
MAISRPSAVPYGTCECGCGAKTTVSRKSDAHHGYVRGRPRRFVLGHVSRSSPVDFVIADRGYSSPCWEWARGLFAGADNGYGQMKVNGQPRYAHRVYWERKHGPVPEGLELDHLCRNRKCVNPAHLEPVTHAENQRRRPVTKLTVETVARIRQLLAEGHLQRVIAAEFGIDPSHVSRIKTGDRGTWQ